jgi:hypothetical protein
MFFALYEAKRSSTSRVLDARPSVIVGDGAEA